jgi:hypothetical protein
LKLANCTGPDFIEILPLNCGGFRRVFDAGTGCDKFGNGFWGSLIARFCPKFMMLAVFRWLHPFKVFYSIVRFNAVLMMNVLGISRIRNPTGCNNPMHKPSSSESGVPITTDRRIVLEKISKDFSAPRNGVHVVKGSIFDSVMRKANHGGNSKLLDEITSYTKFYKE